MTRVVSVTSKGQATIPKDLRDKFQVGKKVLVVETKEGILFKPLPVPREDFGSLRSLFGGLGSKEILDEARAQERIEEKRRTGLLPRKKRRARD
jgi:AbrB family looped-hinge helix DNA binding protein